MRKWSLYSKMQMAVVLLAGALAGTPVCPAAAHVSLVAQSAGPHESSYPSETMDKRLNRIIGKYRVDIGYDAAQMARVSAAPLRSSSLEKDLEASLSGTAYSYKKTGERTYAVYKTGSTASASGQQPRTGSGSLTGTVVDKDGFPIVGATVRIMELSGKGAATDLRGDFTVSNLPARSYTIEVSCISYQTMRVSDVKINSGKSTPLDVILQEASEMLGEVVVTATYNKASANALYAKQKNMAAMSDGISADLMKKTSDNNMAQVLGRVAGVTIEGGKYVTVRGMGERYNNVQLNGASLPSTEPNRRNFSFDVIPSVLVDNVTIAKTFTPDMPGEFTGGLVEVNTLSIPNKKFLDLSIGTGMNTLSTGKDFLSSKRYGADWLFGEINDRKWYTGRSADATQANLANVTAKNSYGLRRYTAAPVQNYSVTAGLPIELFNGHRLGIVAALTYRNEQTTEEIKEGKMITRDSIYRPSHRYRFVTAAGAVANIGWETDNHKITWRNLYNSRFTHTASERYIYKYYNERDDYEQYSVPLVSHLFQTQLDGEHKLFNQNLIFTWNASYNKIDRTNPDDRLARGQWMGESPDGEDMVNWNLATMDSNPYTIDDSHAMYSRLSENKKNIGANLEYPFAVMGNQQKIKAGYMGTFRRASFEQQYLKAQGSVPLADANYGMAIEDYFSPSNFGEGKYLNYVVSGLQADRADFYEGKQDIHAAYLMGEFTFFRKLHLIGGVRMENADTEVLSILRDAEGNQKDSTVVQKKTDWLPAAALTYNIMDNLNVRFAYSKTIARPDFRELSRTSYYNVDDRVFVFNTKPLKQSSSDNFDLRFEWYPQAGEVVSLSGFIKKFKNPVEMITQMESSMQKFNMYSVNLDEATVKGIEFNVRKSLGFLAPASFLKDLYLSGNFSYITGDVNYTAIRNDENKRKRPLMGLAPYTINAGLTYQGKVLGAALNYGRKGRTLVMSGDYEKYDQYENPRNVLDLQISARFLDEKLEVKFNASDLLNEDIIVYRNCAYGIDYENNTEPDGAYTDRTALGMNYNPGDWVMSRIKKGINLSLSVGYKF